MTYVEWASLVHHDATADLLETRLTRLVRVDVISYRRTEQLSFLDVRQGASACGYGALDAWNLTHFRLSIPRVGV